MLDKSTIVCGQGALFRRHIQCRRKKSFDVCLGIHTLIQIGDILYLDIRCKFHIIS